MRREEIKFFLNKTVKLVKNDGFVLTGKILRVNDDSLLFETVQATALISLDGIGELILRRRG